MELGKDGNPSLVQPVPLLIPVQAATTTASSTHVTSQSLSTRKHSATEMLDGGSSLVAPPTLQHLRPHSPAQDSSEEPSKRKRVRSSMDSAGLGYPSTMSRRRSNGHGSPLNPQNTRHTSLSAIQSKRRTDNAFEQNPMFETGMDIFQDPLSSSAALDAKVLELQRKTREIGPAPLPPKRGTTPPPLKPATGLSPRAPQSPNVEQHQGTADLSAKRTLSPVPSTSAPALRSQVSRPLSPGSTSNGSWTSPQTEPSRLPPPDKERREHTKAFLGQLLSDLKWKGKHKEQAFAEDATRLSQAEEKIASIRASPVANDPAVKKRVATTADQLSRRYRFLKTGEPPPNLLDAVRWRNRLLASNSYSTVRGPTNEPHSHSASFDVSPVITEDRTVDDIRTRLYSPADIEALAWVKCLNTLHLHLPPSGKEIRGWHLTAGVVEAYLSALRIQREKAATKQPKFYDSPSSGHLSFPTAERRVSDSTKDSRHPGRSPRSSFSVSSGQRIASGSSSFWPPFVQRQQSADDISISASSQLSHGQGVLLPRVSQDLLTPTANGGTSAYPSSAVTPDSALATNGISTGGASRRSSIDNGPTNDPQRQKAQRRIRNSLPGILDSSKHSLTQLLSPLSTSGMVPSSPHAASFSDANRAVKTPRTAPTTRPRGLLGPHLSDEGEGSGHSSASEHLLSPVVSTSDDNRPNPLERMKRRVVGDAFPRKGLTHPPLLGDLIESERDAQPSRSASAVDLPKPRRVSGEHVEPSTSEDDFSFGRLKNSRAGRKVAKSWNALTKRDGKTDLYEERANQLHSSGMNESSQGSSRPPLFSLDTNVTERGGTRSDHRLRAGKRFLTVRSRQVYQEMEEARRARKQEEERRDAALYDQRLSLVIETRRQSEALNYILQIAVRAIADFVNRQTALADTYELPLDPDFGDSLLRFIEPTAPSQLRGWRAVEEEYASRSQRRRTLDSALRALQRSQESLSLDEDQFSQEELDIVSEIYRQIDRIEEMGRDMEREVLHAGTIQSELAAVMDQAEMTYNQTTEMVDTPYPQLGRNEELARLLSPDNVSDLLPDWVPDSAQVILVTISPAVRYFADFILWSWKHNRLVDYIPDTWKNVLLQCIIATWNGTVKTYSFLNWAAQVPGVRHLLRLLSTALSEYPIPSFAFALSSFYLWFVR